MTKQMLSGDFFKQCRSETGLNRGVVAFHAGVDKIALEICEAGGIELKPEIERKILNYYLNHPKTSQLTKIGIKIRLESLNGK